MVSLTSHMIIKHVKLITVMPKTTCMLQRIHGQSKPLAHSDAPLERQTRQPTCKALALARNPRATADLG